jgi:hypothetical protein
MLLGGLWHGAGWGFVIWGGLHGLYLCVNHGIRALAGRSRLVSAVAGQGWLGWAVTFLAVVFAWVFFRAATLQGGLTMAGAMLGAGPILPADWARQLGGLAPAAAFGGPHLFLLKTWALEGAPMLLAALALALLAPNTNRVFLAGDRFYASLALAPAPPVLRWRPAPGPAAAVSLLFVCAVLYASTISEFLYFQF